MFVFTGRLLDISSPVKVTASSLFSNSSGPNFPPELAIQADTSYIWANCFVSKKEPHPWFTLEFKSVTPIFNVRLGVRDRSSEQLPDDYNLSGMTNLSVYVSNLQGNKVEDKTRCGKPWAYRKIKIIDVNCGKTLKGQFIHVIVPSSSPTYLMICSIVLNKENGTINSTIKILSHAIILFSKAYLN